MRYCPNFDCPHALATGSAAEYREGIASCSDCGTDLVSLNELDQRRAGEASAEEAASRSSWKTGTQDRR